MPELRVNSLMQAAIAERRRQVDAEGFTPEHDDRHVDGELAAAAACYIVHAANPELWPMISGQDDLPPLTEHDGAGLWPFELSWWKPKDTQSDLVRGLALLLAEGERLDRLRAGTGGDPPPSPPLFHVQV